MSAPALEPDAQAIAMLCSTLALATGAGPKQLSAKEWQDLSKALERSDFAGPGELLAKDAADLADALELQPAPAERLEALLARGGQLAFEVERLASRGIWILTTADADYPRALERRLGGQAPPLLFGAGRRGALGALEGVAIVGSRDIDDDGLEFAAGLGRRCAQQRLAVVSGAARGADMAAMLGALDAGGVAVGITVDPLERMVRRSELRPALSDGMLVLLTPFHPQARWQVGNAMRRNRLIYALASAAIVVASSTGKGGTRNGALENLEAGWVPLFVRDDGSAGNRKLLGEGALALPAGSPSELDLTQLSEVVSRPTLLDSPSDEEATPQPQPQPMDIFELAWPALERYLGEPRREREVADRLGVVPAQARAWLNRAVVEGRASKLTRPVRYVVGSQPSLFKG